jgi:hypothetical protein
MHWPIVGAPGVYKERDDMSLSWSPGRILPYSALAACGIMVRLGVFMLSFIMVLRQQRKDPSGWIITPSVTDQFDTPLIRLYRLIEAVKRSCSLTVLMEQVLPSALLLWDFLLF